MTDSQPEGRDLTEESHDVDCSYAGGPGEPYFQPHFWCSCGWSVRMETWEEAGAALDAHLEGR